VPAFDSWTRRNGEIGSGHCPHTRTHPPDAMKSGSAPRRMIEAGVQSSSKRILNPGELSAPLKVHAERDAPFAPLSCRRAQRAARV
jgi:hypothetical protein